MQPHHMVRLGFLLVWWSRGKLTPHLVAAFPGVPKWKLPGLELAMPHSLLEQVTSRGRVQGKGLHGGIHTGR